MPKLCRQRLAYVLFAFISLALSSCSILVKHSDFTAAEHCLEIGMDLDVASKRCLSKIDFKRRLVYLTPKLWGNHVSKDMLSSCNKKNFACAPENLLEILSYKGSEVQNPGTGARRAFALTIYDEIFVYYDKDSRKVVGWFRSR